MGLFDALLGNASVVDDKDVKKELNLILTEGEEIEEIEEIEAAFKLIRDLIVFTKTRLILVDKQGITGKKVEYHSIPFKSISHFSVETAGTFDMDAELKVWISGSQTPHIEKQFRKDKSIYDIQKILATVCV